MNPNRYLILETKRWTSVLDQFRKEKKITEEFEIQLNNISLEDLIALKLDLSCRTQKSPVFGIPIWKNLNKIVKDAILKFAISTTSTPSEGARLLGLRLKQFSLLARRFKLRHYYIRKSK